MACYRLLEHVRQFLLYFCKIVTHVACLRGILYGQDIRYTYRGDKRAKQNKAYSCRPINLAIVSDTNRKTNKTMLKLCCPVPNSLCLWSSTKMTATHSVLTYRNWLVATEKHLHLRIHGNCPLLS